MISRSFSNVRVVTVSGISQSNSSPISNVVCLYNCSTVCYHRGEVIDLCFLNSDMLRPGCRGHLSACRDNCLIDVFDDRFRLLGAPGKALLQQNKVKSLMVMVIVVSCFIIVI